MKKIMSTVVALTLIFAMSLSVCAAPSVQAASGVTGPNGAPVTIKELSEAKLSDAKNAVKNVVGAKADNYKAAVAVDIIATEPGDYEIEAAGLNGLKPEEVIVLHECKQHNRWEVVEVVSVGNGKLVARFDHGFSPVVIFVKASAVSPKTADASMTTAACVAMIAVAGLAISKKKFA